MKDQAFIDDQQGAAQPMKIDQATEDRLRELGAVDDMLHWLREPDAVRLLLGNAEVVVDGEPRCAVCNEVTWLTHDRECIVAAAWRRLKLPQWDDELERAETEARAEDERRLSEAIRRGTTTPSRLNDWFRQVYGRQLK